MIEQNKMSAKQIEATWKASELASELSRTVGDLPCRLFKEGEAALMLDYLDRIRAFLNCADAPDVPQTKAVELPQISSPYAMFRPYKKQD